MYDDDMKQKKRNIQNVALLIIENKNNKQNDKRQCGIGVLLNDIAPSTS